MKYSKSFRNSILKKVLPPENRSVYSVAKEAGIAPVTINSWLSNLKSGKLDLEQDSDDPVNERGMKEKLELLLEYQKIPEDGIGEWLRQKGLHSEHIVLFRQEIAVLMVNKSDEKDTRIREKEGTSRKKPDELKATAKNQVWMWDITWLKTDVKGIYYYAYVIEDLYDRSIVGWAIYENESDEHARDLFKAVTEKEGASPEFVHSDNGSAMKGITLVAFYYRLGIVPSFSRPRVSDDNPFIESFFKTLKYTCGYPKFFSSIDHARKWFADFINWYNTSHKHSWLQYITPFQKRSGLQHEIFSNRNTVIEAAKEKYPHRWGNRATKKYVDHQAEILNRVKKDVA